MKLMMSPVGTNNKYYEMCENDDNTFTVHYGRMGGIRSTVIYPMAQWDKKFREKVAKGYVENPLVEAVTDAHTLQLIRQMMGSDADRLDAVFSVRHAATDHAFNAYVRQQSSRKTLALWHGNFHESGDLALYEVHVGTQLDASPNVPKHMRFIVGSFSERLALFSSGSRQQAVTLPMNEFIVTNPAQCTIRYIVRIKA